MRGEMEREAMSAFVAAARLGDEIGDFTCAAFAAAVFCRGEERGDLESPLGLNPCLGEDRGEPTRGIALEAGDLERVVAAVS